MCNIAVVSVHTSPLARPGTRDSGGMNVYIRELSRQLCRRAHTMDIFTRRTDPDSPQVVEIDGRTRVIQIETGPLDADKASLHLHLPEFRRGVIRFQEEQGRSYDLVHSHYWLSGWVGQALKARWGVPHVIMFHTLGEVKNRARVSEREPDYRIAGERLVAQGADRIICASEGERRALIEYYGVSPALTVQVPCGVDMDHFRPMSSGRVRRSLGLPQSEMLVLYVGRIEPLKGIDILLRAAAETEGRFCLLIVGGDSKDAARKAELRKLADELGISDRVILRDAVPHEQLPLYYNAADVCVVPSYYESFGLVALEAMACGIPVVASRVGGLLETVKHGQTGYLVPWRCPEPFAERLELLLDNETLRRSLGRMARAAVERFRWAEVATRVEEVYHELVSQYRGVSIGAHVA
ncbi:MAG: glycosyltransferase [Chloroflexi bacterium]|nr:glycosyltransferase [Chloroflexota bacterium]